MGSHLQISPEKFDWVQLRVLAWTLKEIHRVVSKPLICCLAVVFMVIALLEGEPSAQSEVLNPLDLVFIKDVSVHCSVQLSPDPGQSPCPCCYREKKHTT